MRRSASSGSAPALEALDPVALADAPLLARVGGWHAEQASTWIACVVERVSKLVPQVEQVTVATCVCGWIVFFMIVLPSVLRRERELVTVAEGLGERREGLALEPRMRSRLMPSSAPIASSECGSPSRP